MCVYACVCVCRVEKGRFLSVNYQVAIIISPFFIRYKQAILIIYIAKVLRSKHPQQQQQQQQQRRNTRKIFGRYEIISQNE